MKNYLLCVAFLLLPLIHTLAQVVNDSIEHRLQLLLNQAPHTSRTDLCTVQWNCVDESLTGKDVEYHNDQWYYFVPAHTGTYFLNIGGQQCRDRRGVQAVVIDGQPCQPTTYRIINHASLANQNDVFLRLNNLMAGKTYLVVIDGYLEDYCQFTIQVATKATGLPTEYRPEVLTSVGHVIDFDGTTVLSWHGNDSLLQQTAWFSVWRAVKGSARSQQIATIPLRRNAAGWPEPEYTLTDSLPNEGYFQYTIYTHNADNSHTALLAKKEVNFQLTQQQKQERLKQSRQIQVNLDYPKKTPLLLQILDAATGKVLHSETFKFNSNHRVKSYGVGHLPGQEIFFVKVLIVNTKTLERKQHDYNLFDR